MKHPILLSYTFEELMYEYYVKIETELHRTKSIEAEGDKIEEEKWESAEAWADEEEQKEREQLEEQNKMKASSVEQSTKQTESDDPYDPSKDPEAIEWMEKEMAKAKELYGDDFGEDLSLDMEEDK